MTIEEILSSLRAERDRLDRAIEALESSGRRHYKTRGRRKISPEGRKRISEAMKRRWAERRKKAKTAAA